MVERKAMGICCWAIRRAHAAGSQSEVPASLAVGKQRSAAAEVERLETWRDAEVGMGDLVLVRRWQPGESVPGDERGPGIAVGLKLVVRRLRERKRWHPR